MSPPPSSFAPVADAVVDAPAPTRVGPRMEKAERVHAVGLLVMGLGAWAIPSLWLLVGTAVVLFGGMLFASRSQLRNGFGVPNSVTSIRLVLTLCMLFVGWIASTTTLAVLGTVVLILDGLDGWLARRFKQESEFGARFDMETDAFLVLALSLILVTRETVGPWVLVAGFWRYAYVVLLSLWPALAPEPRNRLGRAIFVVLVIGLTLAMVLPAPFAGVMALIATLAVSYSFLRSIWWSYAPLWRRDSVD